MFQLLPYMGMLMRVISPWWNLQVRTSKEKENTTLCFFCTYFTCDKNIMSKIPPSAGNMSAKPLPSELILWSPCFFQLQHGKVLGNQHSLSRAFPGKENLMSTSVLILFWNNLSINVLEFKCYSNLPDFKDSSVIVKSSPNLKYPLLAIFCRNEQPFDRVFISTWSKEQGWLTRKEEGVDLLFMEGRKFCCLLSNYIDKIFKTSASCF